MENKPTNLRNKLLLIQKNHKTFAQTEGSDKKANGNPAKSAYNFTPGWRIVESIRQMMDDLNIMLDSTLVDETHEMISYPVYKIYNGQITPFDKREMYVTIRKAFTWVDADSGETLGPFIQEASGANGTDKSLASAESLCERYFLLKQFHISTRDNVDEPDAHDSSNIPGNINLADAQTYDKGQGYAPRTQMPENRSQQPARNAQTQPCRNSQPTYRPQTGQTREQLYTMAVNELCNYAKGTQTHNELMNKWLTILNQSGYETSDPKFAANLMEAAAARRENRQPNFTH